MKTQLPTKPFLLALVAIVAFSGSQASAGTYHKCHDVDPGATIYAGLCVDIEEPPGSTQRVARFSAHPSPIIHFNVLYRSGGKSTQIELAPGEPWRFSVSPGKVIKYAVQLCEKPFAARSRCTRWLDLTYPEEVAAAPPAGPTDKDKAAAKIPKVGKGLASPGGIAATPSPFLANLAVTGLAGPKTLKSGLSGTYTVAVKNLGQAPATVELDIHFAGKLDQTGQIAAGAGLACEVRPVAGVNSSVHCTGGRLDGEALTTVTVQGRGQQTGAGRMIATVNNSRTVKESDYNNNLKQLDIMID